MPESASRPAPSGSSPAVPTAPAEPASGRRGWLILAVVGVAQLMVVLDATIVNIALPSAQQALGFSIPDRQWVITAYALAFGGLLIVGGRLSDLLGRKRTFVAGLAGFAAASAFGGAAPDGAALLAGSSPVRGSAGLHAYDEVSFPWPVSVTPEAWPASA
jgi:MFS family permease